MRFSASQFAKETGYLISCHWLEKTGGGPHFSHAFVFSIVQGSWKKNITGQKKQKTLVSSIIKQLGGHETIDSSFSGLETASGRKREEHWRKKSVSCEGFFAVTSIRLIWLDIFVERANHVEKSLADWMNQDILEQLICEERKM